MRAAMKADHPHGTARDTPASTVRDRRHSQWTRRLQEIEARDLTAGYCHGGGFDEY